MTSADLLLHPVRLRIVQAFSGDRALTTSRLRSELPEIPTASLYRHVARLVDGGVLMVVAERRVRGARERTYALRAQPAKTTGGRAKMTPDEHRQAFLAFLAGLVGDFDRYVARGGVDLWRDGVTYNVTAIWLDETELGELIGDFVTVVQPRLANKPGRGRKCHLLGTVMFPGERPGPA